MGVTTLLKCLVLKYGNANSFISWSNVTITTNSSVTNWDAFFLVECRRSKKHGESRSGADSDDPERTNSGAWSAVSGVSGASRAFSD